MKIKSLILVGIAALAMTACSNNDEYSLSNDDNVIRLKASVAGMATKASSNSTELQNESFLAGETVNVYIKNQGTDTNVEGITGDYITYTANNGWLSTTETPKYPESGAVDIYALYPSTVDKNASFFTVKEDQGDDGNYRASDLMCAVAANKTKLQGGIELIFDHCLSKVIFKIQTTDTSLDIEDLNYFYLTDVYRTVNIQHNQTTGLTLSTNSNIGPVRLDGPTTTGDLTAIIIPQTVPAGTQLCSFLVGGTSIRCIATNDITFEPGCVHTITLDIDTSGVQITGYLVKRWSTGSSYSDIATPY